MLKYRNKLNIHHQWLEPSDISNHLFKPAHMFTNMSDQKLIEAVRSHSCLWQTSSKHYKDVKAKENSWREVLRRLA